MTGPVYFETAQHFRVWLAEHAHVATELLVGFRKVGSGMPSMRWAESVDQALCFGWIDGVRKRIERMLHSIVSAKEQETRDGRLARLIEDCARGRRLDQG